MAIFNSYVSLPEGNDVNQINDVNQFDVNLGLMYFNWYSGILWYTIASNDVNPYWSQKIARWNIQKWENGI